jgi:Ca-activated chloride channel family protein
MAPAARLPLVRRGLELLAKRLRAQDHVAIVTYAGSSEVVLPPTSGAEPGKILAAISGLWAGGSTNGGAGIRQAYTAAREHFVKGGINRVLLATDGDFNVGTTSEDDLVALIERERESGVFLTVLGVGDDNLKDGTMKKLADHGNGSYCYLDSFQEAARVLHQQAGATLVTIAKDVKLQVELNPARVQRYRLIGYECRALAARDFNDDRKDAGEVGAGHCVTALYEVVPVGAKDAGPAVDELKYQRPSAPPPPPAAPAAAGHGDELLTVKVRYQAPDAAPGGTSTLLSAVVRDADGGGENLRFASAVAAFGMLLSGSPHRGEASFDVVEELLSGLADDAAGDRGELKKLVATARALAAQR